MHSSLDRLQSLCPLCHQTDIFRIGAAASAQHRSAFFVNIQHVFRKFFRAGSEDSFPLFFHRQARVGIGNQGKTGNGPCPGHQFCHQVRPQPAVEANGIHTESLRHQHCCFHIGAVQQLAVLIKGKGNEYGQVAVFLCRQYGRLGLVGIAHCFDQDQVGFRLYAGPDCFRI